MTRSSEYQEGEYSHCTIGVFEVAELEAINSNREQPNVVRSASALAQQIFMAVQEINSIPMWNDADVRTEDEVHEAFRLTQKFVDNLE